jgi:hypothetical protein
MFNESIPSAAVWVAPAEAVEIGLKVRDVAPPGSSAIERKNGALGRLVVVDVPAVPEDVDLKVDPAEPAVASVLRSVLIGPFGL